VPERRSPRNRFRFRGLLEARSRGLEGGLAGAASQVLDRTGAETLTAGQGAAGPDGSSAALGVTVSHAAVTEALLDAVEAWRRGRDVGTLVARLSDLQRLLGSDGGADD
jgi:hypothetical protein